MTLHLRHVLKCSLECGGGGGGLDTGHGDNVSGGGRHTGPALCSQQPASLVTGLIGCCCSACAVLPGWCGSMPRWSGRITSLAPVLLLSRCHAVSRSHQPPPPGRGRAGLGPAAAARQLQRDLRLDYAGRQNIAARQFFVLWRINIRYQLIGRLRTWYFRIFLGSQK